MREIVLATRNYHKVREILKLLSGVRARFLTLKDFPGVSQAKESGRTLKANASEKALSAARATKRTALSDDTGLFVDALKGAPGVHSARFAGKDVSYEANNRKLLRLLRGVPSSKRGAAFICVAALARPSGKMRFFEGRLRGRIAEKPAGKNGFGYDPLFFIPSRKKTLAQITLAEKNRISHRAQAFKRVARTLKSAALLILFFAATARSKEKPYPLQEFKLSETYTPEIIGVIKWGKGDREIPFDTGKDYWKQGAADWSLITIGSVPYISIMNLGEKGRKGTRLLRLNPKGKAEKSAVFERLALFFTQEEKILMLSEQEPGAGIFGVSLKRAHEVSPEGIFFSTRACALDPLPFDASLRSHAGFVYSEQGRYFGSLSAEVSTSTVQFIPWRDLRIEIHDVSFEAIPEEAKKHPLFKVYGFYSTLRVKGLSGLGEKENDFESIPIYGLRDLRLLGVDGERNLYMLVGMDGFGGIDSEDRKVLRKLEGEETFGRSHHWKIFKLSPKGELLTVVTPKLSSVSDGRAKTKHIYLGTEGSLYQLWASKKGLQLLRWSKR